MENNGVSIPYTSGHPFLHAPSRGSTESKGLCQSPIHRDTHFYFLLDTLTLKTEYWGVSIPYTSGHPFLQQHSQFGIHIYRMCQSPIHRDTHFYARITSLYTLRRKIVSIPYTSGHPFLRGWVGDLAHPGLPCVNPLYIGTPISTSGRKIEMGGE